MLVNEYNGFRNRETWLVNLWIANDEGLHNEVDQLIVGSIQETLGKRSSKLTHPERAINSLAEKLKEFLEEHSPVCSFLMSDGVYRDLLDNALAEVDYDQLADLYVRDCLAESEGE